MKRSVLRIQRVVERICIFVPSRTKSAKQFDARLNKIQYRLGTKIGYIRCSSVENSKYLFILSRVIADRTDRHENERVRAILDFLN